VNVIRLSLRDRMKFYKLRVTPDAANKAIMFNTKSQPEIIPEENDIYRVKFIQKPPEEEFLVGEKVEPAGL
jgi:actin-related protein 8